MNVLKMTDQDLAAKRVLIREDLNVPVKEGVVTSDARIRAALPTIKAGVDAGARVMLMSHLGRPKEGQFESTYSLAPVAEHLGALLNQSVRLAPDWLDGVEVEEGEVVLCENVRFNAGEKADDEGLSRKMAALCDIFVMDAFGTAHRAHASTTIVAKHFDDKCSGYVMTSELANAKKVLDNAERPFTAIMGGAKISDKILIIERLLDKVDNLLIGGGMSYTFFKAMGGKVGNSLVEQDKLEMAKALITKAKEKGVNLELPKDSIAADKFENDANQNVSDNYNIAEGWMGLDIGPEATVVFSNVVEESKTILWNGPMGVFEMFNFSKGTNAIAQAVVKATENGAFSLIGGGDSAAAINNLGYGEKVSYVSTGGGALLEYMEGKVLPGVAALEEE